MHQPAANGAAFLGFALGCGCCASRVHRKGGLSGEASCHAADHPGSLHFTALVPSARAGGSALLHSALLHLGFGAEAFWQSARQHSQSYLTLLARLPV